MAEKEARYQGASEEGREEGSSSGSLTFPSCLSSFLPFLLLHEYLGKWTREEEDGGGGRTGKKLQE